MMPFLVVYCLVEEGCLYVVCKLICRTVFLMLSFCPSILLYMIWEKPQKAVIKRYSWISLTFHLVLTFIISPLIIVSLLFIVWGIVKKFKMHLEHGLQDSET